jgi:hypothetical protein
LLYLIAQSIDHWYNFYLEHDTYRAVGWLDVDDIPLDAPLPDDQCLEEPIEPIQQSTNAAAQTANSESTSTTPDTSAEPTTQ